MNFNCITKDRRQISAGVSMNFETPPKKYFPGEKTSYRRGFNDLRLKTSLFQSVFYLKIMFLVFLTKKLRFCWGHWKFASNKSDYPHENPFSFLYFFLQGLQSIKIRQSDSHGSLVIASWHCCVKVLLIYFFSKQLSSLGFSSQNCLNFHDLMAQFA